MSLLDSALDYARRGWPVFPLHTVRDGACSCGSSSCSSPGKHPLTARGVREATTEEAMVRWWWEERPEANIGIATGTASGVVVLDIDPQRGGDSSLAAFGSLPATIETMTGGGGRHLFFIHPGSGSVISNRVNLAPGIDVRGDGGYVVAPPSQHASGLNYAWHPADRPLDGMPPAPLPEWLLRRLTGPSVQQQSSAVQGVPIQEGARNSTLASLAGTMRKRGMSPEAIEAALLADNYARCTPPLAEAEVRRIAASVARYAPAEASEWQSTKRPEVLLAEIRTLQDRRQRPVEVPRPLIPALLWPQSVVMLFGPTGVGKTTFLINLALHAATASPEETSNDPMEQTIDLSPGVGYGLPKPTRRLKVLYVGAEDSLPMFEHTRLTPEVLEQYAHDRSLDENFEYVCRRLIIASRTEKEADLEQFIRETQERGAFDLIVLDPIARFFVGFDENDNGEMSQVMAALDTIRTQTGAAVLFCHHTGKYASRNLKRDAQLRRDPTAARGASVLADQSHVVLSLTAGNGQTLVLTWAKCNYAILHRPLIFERQEGGVLRPVANDQQVFVVKTVAQKIAQKGNLTPRHTLVEAVSKALTVSNRHARRMVSRAQELGLVFRVTEDGEPDDGGKWIGLPETH